ncbi:unnamed protein product [Protopolystoma xenopodis]|uniref:Uncharacterized protein n=1 Tax=Protopolystoma xenopodis TaxID=117903 RepID=A0A448XDN2_9PLAT|nr:unnamed protein product [Protopolystoma xenopodis]
MVSCFDDVCHMTDESSATSHRDRRARRRRPIRTNLQPQLQGNSATASGGSSFRILYTRLFKRNERYSNIGWDCQLERQESSIRDSAFRDQARHRTPENRTEKGGSEK